MKSKNQKKNLIYRNRFCSYTTTDEIQDKNCRQKSLGFSDYQITKTKVLIAYFDINQGKKLIDIKDLRKIFIPFGKIARLLIKSNKNNPRQIQTFVEFEDESSIELIYNIKIKHKTLLNRSFVNDLGVLKIDKSYKHKKLFPKNFYQFWDIQNNKNIQRGQQKLTQIFENYKKEQNFLSQNEYQFNVEDENVDQVQNQLIEDQVVVYIKNFNILEENEIFFLNFFGVFGDVNKIIYQPNKQQVFVQYDYHEGAKNCVESLNNLKLKNKKIKAQFSYNKDQLYFDEQKSLKGEKLNKNYLNKQHKKRYINNLQKYFIPMSKKLIIQSKYSQHINPKYILDTLSLKFKNFQILNQFSNQNKFFITIQFENLLNSLEAISQYGIFTFYDGTHLLMKFSNQLFKISSV